MAINHLLNGMILQVAAILQVLLSASRLLPIAIELASPSGEIISGLFLVAEIPSHTVRELASPLVKPPSHTKKKDISPQ